MSQSNIHPLWLRVTHWLNAIAVIVLVLSGWRIYNATAFFGFSIPSNITVGGWLGGALQWHFAAMWLLVFNGCVYLATALTTCRFTRKFFPISIKEIFADLAAALRGRLVHEDIAHYNAVQKVAYLFIILDIVVLICSGLVLWKSVQFPALRELLGGYELCRRIHFFAMAALVGFFVVHVVMVALVPRTFVAMIRGK